MFLPRDTAARLAADSQPQVAFQNRLISFRVVCRRADGTCGLVCLAPTLPEAVRVARRLADRHLARLTANRSAVVRDPQRPREIYTQRWVGTALAGHWETVEPAEGGYRFEFFDHAPRVTGSGRQRQHGGSGPPRQHGSVKRDQPAGPKSGDVVLCELLQRRSRKGGWFAKLVGLPASGPITNSGDLPADSQPGELIRLKLCGIKPETHFAQFQYVRESSEARGCNGAHPSRVAAKYGQARP